MSTQVENRSGSSSRSKKSASTKKSSTSKSSKSSSSHSKSTSKSHKLDEPSRPNSTNSSSASSNFTDQSGEADPHPSEPLIYYLNDPSHSNPGYSSTYTAALVKTYGFPDDSAERTELEDEMVAEARLRAQGNVDSYREGCERQSTTL